MLIAYDLAVLASSTVALQTHARTASGRWVITIIGKVTYRDRERNGTFLSSYANREIAINDSTGGSATRFIALAGVGVPGTPNGVDR